MSDPAQQLAAIRRILFQVEQGYISIDEHVAGQSCYVVLDGSALVATADAEVLSALLDEAFREHGVSQK